VLLQLLQGTTMHTCQGSFAAKQHRAAALVLVQEAGVLEVRHHGVLALDARIGDAADLQGGEQSMNRCQWMHRCQ
jgi:hypothetical protein